MKTRQVIQTFDENHSVWFGSEGMLDKTFENANAIQLTFEDNGDVWSVELKKEDDVFSVQNSSEILKIQATLENDEPGYSNEEKYFVVSLYSKNSPSAESRITYYYNDKTNDLFMPDEYNLADSQGDELISSNEDELIVDASPSQTSVPYAFQQLHFKQTGKVYFIRNAKFIDSSDKSSYAKDLEAVRQYLIQHLSIIQHELWYNYMYGLPLFDTGITKAMIDAEVISIINSNSAVRNISKFNSDLKDKHNYVAVFTVNTIYGDIEISI